MLELLSIKKPVMSYLSREEYIPAQSHLHTDSTLNEPVNENVKESSVLPSLHIQLLGDFRLQSDNALVTSFDLPRLQSLLSYLVLHRDAPQPRSHLAFLLWPDSTDAQAYNNLRTLLHRMRHALPNADAFLHVDRQGLYWSPEANWSLDVLDFEQALAQAERAKDATVARSALERAVSLYRGDLMPSCYDEWILPERDRLRQSYLGALQRLIDVLEAERDYAAAISVAQRLLREEPLHEETYRRLMRLYAVNGDRAAALRVYQSCVSTLEREMGVQPGKTTREAYQRLVQTDTLPQEPKTTMAALTMSVPLVGRQHEWAQLQTAWRNAINGQPQMVVISGEAGIGKTRLAEELSAWRNAINGQPQIVVISGEAGIGKTRLAEELSAWVTRQGLLATTARCYTSMSELAYAPLASCLRSAALRPTLLKLPDVWLTEVARLVPDILVERPQLPRPGTLRESWQQQRFFEALAHALLGLDQPILLVLDDAQWCDRETLAWLHYLLRFNPQARLLVVATARTEEMASSHPLNTLLTSLRRDGKVSEIALAPLSKQETIMLAEHVAGRALDASVATMIYQETEGNPLFIVEIVRTGMRDMWEKGLGRDLSNLPLSPLVQSVISARLSQLSLQAQAVVSLAAVIGRSFSWSVLSRANGEDEETLVSGLDQLLQRGIVREYGDDTYAFSHEKLREAVYSTLGAAQRRLLQRRVAEADATMLAPSYAS